MPSFMEDEKATRQIITLPTDEIHLRTGCEPRPCVICGQDRGEGRADVKNAWRAISVACSRLGSSGVFTFNLHRVLGGFA